MNATPPRERVTPRWSLPCYLVGQGISLLGDSAYYVALAWAAAIYGGAGGVALVSSIAAVPRAVLLLPGGAIADRIGLRRSMLGSDVVRMIAVAVAGLLILHSHSLAVLAVTGLVFGTADAVFMPASSAIPARLVPPDKLQRFNGLMTFARRVALLAGAPLGGLLAAGPGPAAAFLFEAATFAVSLGCLAVLPLRPAPESREAASGRWRALRRGFTEGPRVIWASPMLRGLVIIGGLTELGFTGPYNAGLPLLAQHRHWGAGGMGVLLSAFGLGAALGALAAAAVRRRVRAGHLIIASGIVQAALLALLALVPGLPVALAVSFGIGACSSLYGTTLSTLIQVRSDPARLARVMSVVNLSSYGTVPVANAMTGTISALASVPGAFLVGAAVEGVAAVAGLISRPVRSAAFPADLVTRPEPDRAPPQEDPRPADSAFSAAPR
jgi:MFS family permease